jgi:hypothetical protein
VSEDVWSDSWEVVSVCPNVIHNPVYFCLQPVPAQRVPLLVAVNNTKLHPVLAPRRQMCYIDNRKRKNNRPQGVGQITQIEIPPSLPPSIQGWFFYAHFWDLENATYDY